MQIEPSATLNTLFLGLVEHAVLAPKAIAQGFCSASQSLVARPESATNAGKHD